MCERVCVCECMCVCVCVCVCECVCVRVNTLNLLCTPYIRAYNVHVHA